MNLLKICLFLFSFQATGQGFDPANMAPQQAQPQTQINEFQPQQLQPQLQQQPQEGVVSEVMPGAAPQIPAVHNEAGPPPPAKAGPFTQLTTGPNNSKELEKKIALRVKDPFMLPNHLYLKIKKKLGDVQGEGYVDESVEPQRRWALKRYKLVAIIWNVKKPKAMITDKLNNLHMFHVNDQIGNNEGIITSISNGEVVVDEKGIETKLKMTN